ncbi:MAG TPA: histidine phosphatase family protein [Ktedonobacteraceae bacterium]|jgi:broad specificity phosphatase PhoE
MPTILLIRHGESQANAGLPTSSPESTELTERGWEEARRVAQEMRTSYPALDLVVTSRCRRALQTAEKTRKLFGDRKIPAPVWPVHEFSYLSSWGKRISTVEERRPAVFQYWDRADPVYVDGPQAESFVTFIERVREVKECLDTTNGTTAVFSHHQFICALLWLACQHTPSICTQTMQAFKRFLDRHPLANGAIVRVQFARGGKPWRYEVVTSHLEESRQGEKPALHLSSLGTAAVI